MTTTWTAELPTLAELPTRPRLFRPVPVLALGGVAVGTVEELRFNRLAIAAGVINMRALRRADRTTWQQVRQRRALFVQAVLSCNQQFIVHLDVDTEAFASLDVGVLVFGPVKAPWWRRRGVI